MFWPRWPLNLGEAGGSALSTGGGEEEFAVTTVAELGRFVVTTLVGVGGSVVTTLVGVGGSGGYCSQVPVSVPVVPKIMVPVRLLTVKFPFGEIVTFPLKLKVVPPSVEAF